MGILNVGRLLASASTAVYSPLSLFAAGEAGVWYDPSDFTTMYQDSAGTTPVTAVEQPVGLVLDKSRGLVLGSETSPALSAYQTELTGTWTASGANYAFTDTVGGQVRPGVGWPSISLTPGWYRVVVVVASITGATQIRMDGVGASDQLLTTGTNTRTVLVTVNSRPRLRLEDTSTTIGDGFAITSVSIRELPGSHASQSTAASRPVLSARVNLLTYTEQFDNAAWTNKTTITVTADQATAPDGTLTADQITATANNGFFQRNTSVSAINTNYTQSLYVKKANTGAVIRYDLRDSVNNYAYTFNLDTLAVTKLSATAVDASITGVGNGWFRVSITAPNATAGTTMSTYVYVPTNGDSFYIWGADLRVSNVGVNLPAYQRVVSGIPTTTNPAVTGTADYDTVGFPTYLRFDGVDDSLATGTISPGSVDKAQVFAGVRKLSDAAAAIVVEHSATIATNAGSIYITAPENTGVSGNFAFKSRGSVNPAQPIASGTIVSPTTNVVTGLGDIIGDNQTIRINGADAGSSSADQGTGNYGSYPLYIGRRGGSTLPFNGNLYSLIVRFSAANLDAATITKAETWVNSRTGAY